ncbi:SGNH/GDSL hydrolase family protein [Silvanigrella sp.]|uniref:SGNH/GDSL hydrolase family protein n=1 Tax=Silvanigrella sp. TaxID=2024976 RepID=UPI0037C66AF2
MSTFLGEDHPKIGIDDIVIVSIGGNDILSSIYSGHTDNIDKAIDSIIANLNSLYIKGVGSFIVSNVPDF